MTTKKAKGVKQVETLTHNEASRTNIPTAEFQSVMEEDEQAPVELHYPRNTDLDPQLVWRGKDEKNWSDLVAHAPPLFIQEKVHPKVIMDDLLRHGGGGENNKESGLQVDLFGDFNGLPVGPAQTEFYKHDANWSNRIILGDSLYVMASLAEREGLRNKVQCIYIDPPYGINFKSNFQWSTTTTEVKDNDINHITRDPEQVKAFRDTWRDGIHSYLTYLRDRLTIARDLLTESGSIFVQIGDENVHRVRSLMDEVFGSDNFVRMISYRTSSGTTQQTSIKQIFNYIIWYCKNVDNMKFRRLLEKKAVDAKNYNQLQLLDGTRRPMSATEKRNPAKCPPNSRPYRTLPVHSMASGNREPREAFGSPWTIPSNRSWRFSYVGFERLIKASRIHPGQDALRSIYYHDDFPAYEITNLWDNTGPEIDKIYVVQTHPDPIKRCILMTTDPGDLVLDPTCGSGTTAYVAEEWGRRWITIDTSRVALALARARIMGARFPYYLLADSTIGQQKESRITRTVSSDDPTYNDIRQGFVYERVPHIQLKSIANNSEIDAIWENYQDTVRILQRKLNNLLEVSWQEWDIPRESERSWPSEARDTHRMLWEKIISRQQEIDASIAVNAEFKYLYDRPYQADNVVRVSGPFTVESLSPYRVLNVDEDDKLIDNIADKQLGFSRTSDFAEMILEHLRNTEIQQAHKKDRIKLSSIIPWPGKYISAEGLYSKAKGGKENRAAIFIGPEFGTVSRANLVAATREAAESNFDILISLAFSYDALSADLEKLGRVPVIKAKISPELHMAGELKNTGKGNLFVIFGEPETEIITTPDDQIQVKVIGVDVFDPTTGEIRSDDTSSIACWFLDTDYNEESFFVRHAYFLGAKDPYKKLKMTLNTEINEEAWNTLYSDTSRPFPKPNSGRIAVKVINHLGDEVMKVFRV